VPRPPRPGRSLRRRPDPPACAPSCDSSGSCGELEFRGLFPVFQGRSASA
jgi:hypothetical protein